MVPSAHIARKRLGSHRPGLSIVLHRWTDATPAHTEDGKTNSRLRGEAWGRSNTCWRRRFWRSLPTDTRTVSYNDSLPALALLSQVYRHTWTWTADTWSIGTVALGQLHRRPRPSRHVAGRDRLPGTRSDTLWPFAGAARWGVVGAVGVWRENFPAAAASSYPPLNFQSQRQSGDSPSSSSL